MAVPQTRQAYDAIHDAYGDRLYTAYDDPVALQRAYTRAKLPWILARVPPGGALLDVACGPGFLSNALARAGLSVTGLDLSLGGLAAARRWDVTGRAHYIPGDARSLPFPDRYFSAVTLMDFLERAANPVAVVRECARVLQPGGRLFFSAFNRSPVAWLVGIKLVEWFVRNTPPRLHRYRSFVKPAELEAFCGRAGLVPGELVGLRPRLSTIPLGSYCSGIVPESLEFTLTPSTMLLYLGVAEKPRGPVPSVP
jgi:2-polyprenyl-6-hydroxyphenyl methylase/3-demethylubiquinone-9 3-methyltransferase